MELQLQYNLKYVTMEFWSIKVVVYALLLQHPQDIDIDE